VLTNITFRLIKSVKRAAMECLVKRTENRALKKFLNLKMDTGEYLLHRVWFTNVRNQMLAVAVFILVIMEMGIVTMAIMAPSVIVAMQGIFIISISEDV
jgi:hypothetical protein